LICEKFPSLNTKVPPTVIKLSGQSATVAIDTTGSRDKKAPGGNQAMDEAGVQQVAVPGGGAQAPSARFFQFFYFYS
jgi:hypothetical protein